MDNPATDASHNAGAHHVIAALEQQLTALDRHGAHVAAAHLDAAIQQFRLDCARR